MSEIVLGIIQRFETFAETLAGAHSPLRKPAQEVSQRILWAARAELSMQALQAACMALLETDGAGLPVNIDHQTGRALMPLPWGKKGGVVWGLRSSEQRVLAHILRYRAQEPWALLIFERQAWYVTDGFSRSRVDIYLRRQPITVEEYRQAWSIVAPKWRSARGSATASALRRATGGAR